MSEYGIKVFSDIKISKNLPLLNFVRKSLEGKMNKKQESLGSREWGFNTRMH